MTPPAAEGPPRVPLYAFDPAPYDRRPRLTDQEAAYAGRVVARPNGVWPVDGREDFAKLFGPFYGALDLAGCGDQSTRHYARARLLRDLHRRGRTLWGWSGEEWEETLAACGADCRAYLAVVAFLVGGLGAPAVLEHGAKPTLLAERVFGEEALAEACTSVAEVLQGWGYSLYPKAVLHLRVIVYRALLAARSPRLEDVAGEHLEPLTRIGHERYRNLARLLWRVLASLGKLGPPPGADPAPVTPEAPNDVPEVWLRWCRDWFERSTMRSRKQRFWTLLRVGRWAAAELPEALEPGRWNARVAAEWVAAVDRMAVGQHGTAKPRGRNASWQGKPLSPRGKSHLLQATRSFFRDLQEWEMLPVRFNPDRCLRTPRSVRRLISPDPKPIDAPIWAKLVRAALDLEEEDLPRGHGYPIEMVRAVAVVWVCGALRSDEIVRLRLGCARPQRRDARVPQTGEVLAKDSVCFLDVPINKTTGAYTKPLPPVMGERIAAWERVRPPDQPPALDPKTGEMVHFLFSRRNGRPNRNYINGSLLTILRRKAGVPERDSHGKITAHRARATIASQLRNGPDPWSLTDLQTFLGHTDLGTTQHYVKADPTRLAKKYADSSYLEDNLATFEVLLDVEALAAGEGEQALYYDLGHGLCANPYWHQCPYRMACVRCPMYVPGEQAHLVRAKEGVRRMLETVPLTDEERRAAGGDEEALGQLLAKGEDVPVPADRQGSVGPLVPLTKKPLEEEGEREGEQE